MERIYWETHQGKKILIEDFSGTKPGAETLALMAKAREMIASQPPLSVNALFDASDGFYNAAIMAEMKEFTAANKPYMRKAAVVGVSPLLRLALATLSRFAGREFHSFDTRQDALKWLLE